MIVVREMVDERQEQILLNVLYTILKKPHLAVYVTDHEDVKARNIAISSRIQGVSVVCGVASKCSSICKRAA